MTLESIAPHVDQGHVTKPTGAADLLAVGFRATVAMWTVGYLARLPAVMAPTVVVGFAMLACLFGAGMLIGRYSHRGWRGGVGVGLITTGLNLLILGGLLKADAPDSNVPSMLIWLPGAMLASAAIAAVGAAIGASMRAEQQARPNWTGLFALVAMVATGLLLIAGGLVTGLDAGLSVPDWPGSFGYNMFLYPIGRMTGSIYYEHAHRLYGSLVGLTTITLAVHLWRCDRRKQLARLAAVAIITVVLQGVMGGYRVALAHTGDGIAIARPEHETAVSTILRVAHGVCGQLFLTLMVALAVCTSSTWLHAIQPPRRPTVATDRVLCVVLVAALIGQLLLGALVRHIYYGMMLHMSVGVLVAMLLVITGLRAWWGAGQELPVFRKLSAAMIVLAFSQVVLGVIAAAATGISHKFLTPTVADATISTMHQAVGAALLACATALMLFTYMTSTKAPSTSS
jgi:cytochrome c oxidase assembly protein subunit 15